MKHAANTKINTYIYIRKQDLFLGYTLTRTRSKTIGIPSPMDLGSFTIWGIS